MSGQLLTRLLEFLLPERRAGRETVRWSNHAPTLTLCVSAGIWTMACIYMGVTGFDWTRALVLFGLLLPICGLLPFTIWFRKPVGATILPFRQPDSERSKKRLQASADSIPAVLPLWRLCERVARTGRTDYTVVDEAGRLVGTISLEDLPSYEAREALGWLIAADIMRTPRAAA